MKSGLAMRDYPQATCYVFCDSLIHIMSKAEILMLYIFDISTRPFASICII